MWRGEKWPELIALLKERLFETQIFCYTRLFSFGDLFRRQ